MGVFVYSLYPYILRYCEHETGDKKYGFNLKLKSLFDYNHVLISVHHIWCYKYNRQT